MILINSSRHKNGYKSVNLTDTEINLIRIDAESLLKHIPVHGIKGGGQYALPQEKWGL